MSCHLNHGWTIAQPYGCRSCLGNEKKAAATLMRETGKPPVRIAALAISVENLHARSVVAAAACDPTITLKRNRDGRLRSRTLRQPLATPLAALAKSNGQWVVEAQEPRLYSIANAGCDCFDETGKPSDDPAGGCG